MIDIVIRNAIFKERWELVQELKGKIASCSNPSCNSCTNYVNLIDHLMNAKV